MFADAYEKASRFTKPVIVPVRHFDGSVTCSLGAFVILNPEGWIVTALHMLEPFPMLQQHSKAVSTYKSQVAAIEQEQRLSANQKRKRIDRLDRNPKWVTNCAVWWGIKGDVQFKDLKALPEADLAVARLEPFDPQTVSIFPTFKNPSSLRIGTSLCKLGYPFHRIEATFDEKIDEFILSREILPIPRFPLEGIYTRNNTVGKSKDGKYEIKFLETSSPGLKGQSGGPIFDVKGTVWAIQSHTAHFPLGFSPKITKNNREIEENQFLNVGLGVHPEVLIKFLSDNGIKLQLSDY